MGRVYWTEANIRRVGVSPLRFLVRIDCNESVYRRRDYTHDSLNDQPILFNKLRPILKALRGANPSSPSFRLYRNFTSTSTMKGEVPHSNWSIRCISTPGPDTDLSIYVSFEKARFLFGCGQGSQRAFVQKRLSMRGLGAVFLPGGTEEGRGGVAGKFY